MGKSSWNEDQSALKSQKKTILIVEDSPTQAAQIRALLVSNGIQVLIARDGLEGVEMAEQFLPAVIILDWELPKMNGGEVARILKNNPQTMQIPIIIFTRYDQVEIITAGLQEGAIDFIPKDAFAKVVMIETLKQMGFIKATPER